MISAKPSTASTATRVRTKLSQLRHADYRRELRTKRRPQATASSHPTKITKRCRLSLHEPRKRRSAPCRSAQNQNVAQLRFKAMSPRYEGSPLVIRDPESWPLAPHPGAVPPANGQPGAGLRRPGVDSTSGMLILDFLNCAPVPSANDLRNIDNPPGPTDGESPSWCSETDQLSHRRVSCVDGKFS
jgi:hypothetical protein